MQAIVNWVEILLAVLIVIAVLLQVRGTAGQLFGQADSSFRVRRGFERTLFRATIVLAALFVVVAVTSVRLFSP